MFELSQAKSLFFDKAAVMQAVDKATRKALAKAGAFIRRDARRSIRTREGPAPPGQPPHSHKGHLKRFLFFAWDPASRSVVVGPAALGRANAPPLLEFGGRTTIRTKKGRVQAHYEPRPFMNPALEKNRPLLPTLWKDSIR